MLDNYGSQLQFTCGNVQSLISHHNDGFQFMAIENDPISIAVLERLIADAKLAADGKLSIPSVPSGRDQVDRIIRAQEFLAELRADIELLPV